jgi:CMP-N-acetylneuraminic acid synthetase
MVPVAPTAARADDTAKTSDVIADLAGAAPLESKEAIKEAAEVLDL